ncbi:unnamed protein product, partial [Ectocarpus sp. 4 AP-2014]
DAAAEATRKGAASSGGSSSTGGRPAAAVASQNEGAFSGGSSSTANTSSSYSQVARSTPGPSKGKAPARDNGTGGTPAGGPGNRFGSLATPTGSEEEGEVGEGASSLSQDVLASLQQEGATRPAIDPETPLGKLVFKGLEQAVEANTDPAPWILSLVLGTKRSHDDDVRVTKLEDVTAQLER